MATILNFEELKVWQKARDLNKKLFPLLFRNELKNLFSLRDQIVKSSGSIMDNIAEGFDRGSRKEFIQFLSYSRGSAGELRSQLYRLLDFNFISQEEFNELTLETIQISKMISSFINYLKSSTKKGFKYEINEDMVTYDTHYPNHHFHSTPCPPLK